MQSKSGWCRTNRLSGRHKLTPQPVALHVVRGTHFNIVRRTMCATARESLQEAWHDVVKTSNTFGNALIRVTWGREERKGSRRNRK